MVFDAYPIFLDEVLLSLRLAVEQFRRRSSCVRERLEVVFSFTRPIEDGIGMITGSRTRSRVAGGCVAALRRVRLHKKCNILFNYLLFIFYFIYFIYFFILFILFIFLFYFILFYFILFFIYFFRLFKIEKLTSVDCWLSSASVFCDDSCRGLD